MNQGHQVGDLGNPLLHGHNGVAWRVGPSFCSDPGYDRFVSGSVFLSDAVNECHAALQKSKEHRRANRVKNGWGTKQMDFDNSSESSTPFFSGMRAPRNGSVRVDERASVNYVLRVSCSLANRGISV